MPTTVFIGKCILDATQKIKHVYVLLTSVALRLTPLHGSSFPMAFLHTTVMCLWISEPGKGLMAQVAHIPRRGSANQEKIFPQSSSCNNHTYTVVTLENITGKQLPHMQL